MADLGLSMAAPGYELGAWFWFADVPKSLSYVSRDLKRLSERQESYILHKDDDDLHLLYCIYIHIYILYIYNKDGIW